MVSPPVQNLSDFFKNRPPIVVFLLCLVVLAVCTFYYAFVVENDGPLVNTDKKHDWIKMVKHFNTLDVCIDSTQDSSWTNEIKFLEDQENFNDIVTVYTKASIDNPMVLLGLSGVSGSLTLEEWFSISCPDSLPPKSFIVSFTIPPFSSNATASLDLCVTLKGPARFLPYFKEPLCTPSEDTKSFNITKQGYLSSQLPKFANKQFCEKGHKTKLQFNKTIPKIYNYISDDVGTQIYIHLMWCSYFLVFVIFGILLFAICKRSEQRSSYEYMEKKEYNSRLL